MADKLDQITEKCLAVRGGKPGKLVNLLESDLRHVCQETKKIFVSQPCLLELEAPINICGMHFITRLDF